MLPSEVSVNAEGAVMKELRALQANFVSDSIKWVSCGLH